MARAGGKEIVIVASLLAAGGYVAVHRARSWAEGSGRLTDGAAVRAELDAPLVRHALWDPPRELAPALDGAGGEARPALSPDGRFLVFAGGARGQDANLFVCALAGGVPGEPRPLAGIDGTGDELAPAFSDGFLYFASDRAGGRGGLDLYRAAWQDGRCGEPVRLDDALQSEEDDTDPAPARDDGELVFARVRGAQAALWRALLAADGSAAEGPSRLALGDAPEGAREPALSADGRVLWFSAPHGSSRALWRALWLRERWQPPQRVEELDSEADEAGPCPLAGGFELLFTRAAGGGPAHLWQARSREVYLQPGRPWTWFDSAVVGSLLALALMALLARRWPALELIYKCLLVSVLLHLLLLFLMRYVFLGGGEQAPRGSETHRVRFVPSARAEPQARAESAAGAERAELASLVSPALPDALEALVRPLAPEQATAPERGALARELALAQEAPDVALATPREERAPRGERARELALEAAAARGDSRADAPHAEIADAPASSRLAGPELERPQRDTVAPARTAAEAAPESGSAGAARVALAGPREGAQKTRVGAAPALPLEAAAGGGPGTLAPARAEIAGAQATPSLEGPEASVHAERAPSAPARSSTASGRDPELGKLDAHVALQGPREERKRADAAPAPGLELPGPAAQAPRPAGAPARPALASPLAGASAPGPWKSGAESPGSAPPEAPARAARVDAPLASGAPPLELADREAKPPARRPAGPSGSPDLVADLGRDASAPREAAAPGPRERELPRERTASDAPARDSLVRAPEGPRTEAQPGRQSWDHTPYENRGPEQKARALKLHGGDEHTEEAVARGLDYLARIQQRGGHWGSLEAFDEKYGQVAAGKTGLALLAFLGAGHTQLSGTKHSAVVARAIDALLALQDPESGHFGRSDAYSHGIASYALGEDLAMTGDARVRAALEPALRHILAEQNRARDPRLFGGWSYYFPDGHVFDRWPRTAISAWQVMALESARLSGLEVPDESFESARRFLAGARDADGGFWRYDHDPERLRSEYSTLPASTPAAMFALALLGDDLAAPEYAPAREYVLERAPDGYRYAGDDDFVARGTGNLYFWYYGTLAMFRAGGASWTRWNGAMKRTLVTAQNRDGSWEPIDPYARYARDGAGDKSYTTALCVLSLEVYYRYYLPLLRVR